MPLVQRLSDTLINQIAAGEVVERPASVAKELCENALDAGARQITVEISGGGIDRLIVSDDGCGMDPEDARACLERHATSKLREEAGLKNIGTMGFRGEALPAIASVSKFSLTTRPNRAARRVPTSWESADSCGSSGNRPPVFSDGKSAAAAASGLTAPDLGKGADDASDIGTRIEAEGGEIVRSEETGAPPGTRIEVRDLFYNTPARRKFLKRPATEAANLIEAVSRLAAARPEVGFRLVSSGREVFSSPPARDPKERMAVVLGPEAVRHLIPVHFSRGTVSVYGCITDPDYTLSNAKGIYTYVNGRFVRDRSLVAVIQRAYRDVTEPGRSPACVLFIDVPLADVDINVHPQKLEVRFADAQAVTGCLFRAVQEALRDSPWLARQLSGQQLEGTREGEPDFPEDPAGTQAGESGSREANVLRDSAGIFGAAARRSIPEMIWGKSSIRADIPKHSYEDVPLPFRPRPGTVAGGLEAPPDAVWGSPPNLPEAPSSGNAPQSLNAAPRSDGYFHSLRIIGQFAATYIVCEAPGPKLVVIDQHAAHERVRFHALREAFRKNAPSVQPFLVPLTLEFTPAEAAVLSDHAQTLARIGFEVEPFGGGSIALKAVPQVMTGCDHRKMLADMAAELMQTGRAKAFDEAMDHILATMACHSAIRAHEARTETELRALLDSLDGIDFSTRCPHGRPIAANIAIAELEKEVARR